MHWNTCKDVECSICKDSRNEFSKPMDLEAWDRGEDSFSHYTIYEITLEKLRKKTSADSEYLF